MTKLEQIEAIKNYIIQEIKPEKVILFGSYARGDYKENSDVDMLIVIDNLVTKQQQWELTKKLYMYAPSFENGRDLIIKSQNEFNEWKDSINNLVGRVAREGKVIYDKRPEAN